MNAQAITTIGTAQARWIGRADRTDSSDAVTMSNCVSITQLTTASAWIAVLAIIALIASGWRKPARASALLIRTRRTSRGQIVIPVTQLPSPLHRPTPWWRKVWALIASSGIAIVTGALIATILAFAIAWSVTTLTDMLRQ